MNVKGIFAVDKPVGITSQRAVQIVKYWARRETGNKKIKVGHAGTLDPLASGVLVMGVGREYTKQLDNIVKSEKEYVAEIKLGENSETDDAEGEKNIINKDLRPTRSNVERALENFVGHIKQTPSIYSAIKIDGEEAYKRARRGECVKMSEREVVIKQIDILNYEYPVIKIRVICGKGTYIRTLARDIGRTLETGAYLQSLRRDRVGEFKIIKSKKIDEFNMNIAIHASELDVERIDGTRVYIKEMLNKFGDMASDDKFLIYHSGKFNNRLKPLTKENYLFKKLVKVPFWTQTIFAVSILFEKPDVVWIPLHNIPLIRSKKTKFVVTIHDLAFKFFPQTFTKKELKKLNFLTDNAVKKSDKIIAVSKATKRDLLKFYPNLKSEKITVVPHGVDISKWNIEYEPEKIKKILNQYNLKRKEYLIHTGAIQPRKNLELLIESFEKIKKTNEEIKLVLIGGEGWLSDKIKQRAVTSEFSVDIIFVGNVSFEKVKILMKNANMFVFPSLYEGFGLPVLEACAAQIPVVSARNSSIPEVLGEAGIYFDEYDSDDCANKILKVLNDNELRNELIQRGLTRTDKFTWSKCVRNTLRVLRG